AVLTVSAAVRNAIIKRFSVDPSRVFVTPNGVNEGFKPMSATAFRESQGSFLPTYGGYILSVATFEPRKNLAGLVKAFSLLPTSMRRKYPLVLTGASGWGKNSGAAELARLVDHREAIILGYVDDARLRTLYAGAALFVLPSRYEGFGLPAAEAMACGTA